MRDVIIDIMIVQQKKPHDGLCVQAELNSLPEVRAYVQEAARKACDQPKFIYDLALAVDEVVTNVIIHGYGGGPGMIMIHVDLTDSQVEVLIRDQAMPFDPTQVEEPDLDIPLEDRQIGGLGVYMARVLTDQMIYRWMEGGGNETRLVKRCPTIESV